jgi:hypothetical protein
MARPQDVVIAGESLGGAVATWLAAKMSLIPDPSPEGRREDRAPAFPSEERTKAGMGPRAVVLFSTFTSVTDLGAQVYWFLPVRLLSRIGYDNLENLKRIRGLEREVASLAATLAEAKGFEAPCGEFPRIGRYRQLRAEVEARRRAFGRGGGRRGEAVAEAEPGRLILLRRRGGGSLGAVLSIHSVRGSRVLVDALLPHGAVVRVKSGNIKKVFWATPPLPVPLDWRERQNGLLAQLRELSLSDLLERERAHGSEAELAANPRARSAKLRAGIRTDAPAWRDAA